MKGHESVLEIRKFSMYFETHWVKSTQRANKIKIYKCEFAQESVTKMCFFFTLIWYWMLQDLAIKLWITEAQRDTYTRIRLCECDQCGLKFKYNSYLLDHSRTLRFAKDKLRYCTLYEINFSIDKSSTPSF